MPTSPLFFVVPGSIEQRTGGYVYDARLLRELSALGRDVRVIELDDGFPLPDASVRQRAADAFAGLPDGALVLSDALAGSTLPEVMERHAGRLDLVALVHHPLALETGTSRDAAERLAADERRALAAVRHVIVTSPATARALEADYGVPAQRLSIAVPGTDDAPLANGTASDPESVDGALLRLLCVATLTPRKGHSVLIDALAEVRDRLPDQALQLDLIGSTERAPDTVRELRERIAHHALEPIVTLHGEADAAALERHYARADAFVLASFHEGFGMVLTEAIAHGLPIVATRGGAIADTVPPGAGLLVPPGDAAALADALVRLVDDAPTRAALRRAAQAARARLVRWPETAAIVQRVLDGARAPA